MGLPMLLLFVVSTVVLPLAGDLSERSEPVKLTVKEGEHAVLSCDASAFIGRDTKVDLLSFWWINGDGLVCAFDKGKSHASAGYRNRTEMSRQEGRDAHCRLLINDTVFSDGGKYTCYVGESGKTGYVVTTIHLIVQGQDKSVSVVIGGTLNISLPAKADVKLRFSPASGSMHSPIECIVQQNALRPDCAYKLRATLSGGDQVLQLSQITFMDEGNFTVTLLSTGTVYSTVVLSVEGQSVNQTLNERSDLFLRSLVDPAVVEFQGGSEGSTALRLCEWVNGTMIHPAEGYLQRLAAWNGTLVLSMLTAKDKGKYTMKEKKSGRAALSLNLYIVPLGRNITEWQIPFLILSAVCVCVCVCACKCKCKWKMKRKTSKGAQGINEGCPLNEIKTILPNAILGKPAPMSASP